MFKLLAPALAVGVLALAAPSSASALPGGPGAACSAARLAHSPSAPRICAAAVEGHHMSKAARDCFIGAGVNIAGVVVGGLIGVVAAEVIGRSIAIAGGVGCIGRLV
jgi:hypothetical protein